jgi:hypothetical protein
MAKKEGDPLAKKLSAGRLTGDDAGVLPTSKQKGAQSAAGVGASYDKASSEGRLEKGVGGSMPTRVHKAAQSTHTDGWDDSGKFTTHDQSKGGKKK